MRPNITHSGKTYHLLDDSDALKEDSGRRYSINDVDIAAFRHEGKVFAISNVCPHQGGPMCEGAIKKGYVECPWHQWQFSVEDGSGPPGYDDSIPYYPVIEQDGKAYVNIDQKDTD